jgi:hypothetical protein
MIRRMLAIAIALILALAVISIILGILDAAFAKSERCGLALVLSFDVSSSMDDAEFAAMREGTAQALMSPEVVSAFEASHVAVQVQYWAGSVAVVQDWTMVRGRDDLEVLAANLATSTRADVEGMTAIGEAMLFAAAQIEAGPKCARAVVDIAGDGAHNTGPTPAAVQPGLDPWITINGLATTPAAAAFFDAQVRSEAGFVIVADGYERFTEAMTRKLILEMM